MISSQLTAHTHQLLFGKKHSTITALHQLTPISKYIDKKILHQSKKREVYDHAFS